jgi:hypothetical protein
MAVSMDADAKRELYEVDNLEVRLLDTFALITLSPLSLTRRPCLWIAHTPTQLQRSFSFAITMHDDSSARARLAASRRSTWRTATWKP